MSKKVILSSDSTCDLTPELQEQYHVNLKPYHVILDGREYTDNVDLTSTEMFRIYKEKKVLPKTSAVNVAEFVDYFKQWTEQGYAVVHISLSSGITSSYQNAVIAAEMLDDVYLVDSRNLSTGVAHLVIQAAKLIEQGLSAAEIAEKLTEVRERIHTSFILDTLEFMHAGGRCSAVAALGANLLRLKPCIEMNNVTGKMAVGKKYKGDLKRVLIQYTKDRLSMHDNLDTSLIFMTHTDIEPEIVDAVREAIQETVKFDQIVETNASCTISAHCGPRTLGILFMTK